MTASDSHLAQPLLHALPNGVRLLAVPLPHVRSASVGVFLRVGARDETVASNGIGHVLEHMAFKGTARRDVQAINLDAERLGADVNAWTGKDSTAYFMSGLGQHTGRLLEMTADIVLNSTFPAAELERELEVIRQEAIEYHEDPEETSSELLDRALWGEHPLGMPVIGTLENLDRFRRDDLLAHVQRHYVAGNAVVVAAGNFEVDAFFAQARDLFAAMRPGAAAAVPAPPPHAGGALGQSFAQVSQVFLNLAWPVPPPPGARWDAQRWRLAAALAANLFGGGMSAPLTDTVRERLGLAYSVHATSEAGDSWFNFLVQAVTTPDKMEALLQSTGQLLRAQAERIDPVHLERAKNQLAVARVRAAERPHAAMERAVEELFVHGAATAPAAALALIEDIRAEEVRAVFERMLAQRAALAASGRACGQRAVAKWAGVLERAAR